MEFELIYDTSSENHQTGIVQALVSLSTNTSLQINNQTATASSISAGGKSCKYILTIFYLNTDDFINTFRAEP